MSDKCPKCGHDWHGLTCTEKIEELGPDYRMKIISKCKCASAFVENTVPTLDEGPRITPKKGIW